MDLVFDEKNVRIVREQSKIVVRGIKYWLNYNKDLTFATNEYGEKKLISEHHISGDLAKDRIKKAWKLKPYRTA